MLKKLRRKIILINVILVGVVLAAALTVNCVNSWRTAEADLAASLRKSLDYGFDLSFPDKPHIGGTQPQGGRHFADNVSFVATVSVLASAEGEILQTNENGVSMDSDLLQSAVEQALAAPADQGLLRAAGLMFSRRVTPDGTRIAFAPTATLDSQLRQSLLVSALVGVGGLGVLLLISLWLSGLVVQPIAQAWQQQKQFVADASHELKTPLTVILANNNILLSHPDALFSSQRQWLESSDAEAQRMKTLIDQMLVLAKGDAEQLRPQPERVDVSELLQEQLLYFEPVAFEQQITLAGEIQPELGLTTDPALLRQLVQILLDNGIKYCPGGEQVTVYLQRQGQGLRLQVNNPGEPIPAADLPHIFDRFYRADKARSASGCGLGLAIAKNLSQLLHSELSVTSDSRQGTTFSLLFPS